MTDHEWAEELATEVYKLFNRGKAPKNPRRCDRWLGALGVITTAQNLIRQAPKKKPPFQRLLQLRSS